MQQRTEQHHPATDAPQASAVTTRAAQSPFGPQRKREQPPVKIPGQRKPTSPGPRPTPPTQQLTARPIPHDLWDADRYDRHAAWDAFGAGLPGSAA